MKRNIILLSILLTALAGCKSGSNAEVVTGEKPNVLLICVDDLRPELNCYGAGHIVSPNIDALADEAVVFTRAYTQQAVCAPSRNTLMSGLRPDGLGIYDLRTFFRTKAPDVVTLSQHFMQQGYQAEGMGKIYHTGHGNKNDSLSWSRPHWYPHSLINQRDPIQSGDTTHLHTSYPKIGGKNIPWVNSRLPEELHNDAMVTTYALERMEAMKGKPFFLAVGMVKPHLPFVAPSKYWDLYDPARITVPSPDKPDVHPAYSFTNWGELRKYHGIPAEGLLTEEDAVNMIHGYYACVSLIDAQVGRLTAKLKELDLYDNTIIVLWGDHGWKLGEYGDWCKHTNYELDTRIPVIVRIPKIKAGEGWKSDAIVETVDIYPTLCDLAGLDLPDHLQGSSFRKVLESKEADWSDVAFSQYPRTANLDGQRIPVMGYSMRTPEYRITRWVNRETRETVDIEIYDHRGLDLEMINLAAQEEYQAFIDSLDKELDKHYAKEHAIEFLEFKE
jgi:arylsulfatase A-like enzyme